MVHSMTAWQPEAKERLDAAVDKIPFMSRISASRELQMQVESLAYQENLAEVTLEMVEQALSSRQRS